MNIYKVNGSTKLPLESEDASPHRYSWERNPREMKTE